MADEQHGKVESVDERHGGTVAQREDRPGVVHTDADGHVLDAPRRGDGTPAPRDVRKDGGNAS